MLFPELFTTQLLSYGRGAPARGCAAPKLAEFTPRYLELFTQPGDRVQRQHHRRLAVHASRTRRCTTSPTSSAATARSAKQYKLHVTPSERRWWGVQPGAPARGLRHRPRQDRDPDLLRHRVPRAGAHRGRQGRADPVRALQHRQTATATCACATAPRRAASRTTCTWPSSGCVGNLPFVEQRRHPLRPVGHLHAVRRLVRARRHRGRVHAEHRDVVIHDVDIELLRRHRLTRHGPELERPPHGPLLAALHGAGGGLSGRGALRRLSHTLVGMADFVRECECSPMRTEERDRRGRREPGERDPVRDGISVRLWI